MHRQWLQQKLAEYQPIDAADQAVLKLFQNFLDKNPNCFDREFCQDGNITGSAWIVSPDLKKAVLMHHPKLKKWIQAGGHSDHHPVTLEVALREAQEEIGLSSLKPLSKKIFDLAFFPPLPNFPHTHYDVRFIFQADDQEKFQSQENHQIRWFNLEEIPQFNNDHDLLQLINKTKNLHAR